MRVILKICLPIALLAVCVAILPVGASAAHARRAGKCRHGKAYKAKLRRQAAARRCARSSRVKAKVTTSTPPLGVRPAPASEPQLPQVSAGQALTSEAEPAPEWEAPPPETETGLEEPAPASTGEGAGTASASGNELLLPARFFGPNSFWNTVVPSGASVAPDSKAIVSALVEMVEAEEAAKTGPAINTTKYSIPIYTVPTNQATVEVRLESPFKATALREAFKAVPLPPDAKPAPGNDHHLVVWQPSTDRLWEFWHLVNGTTGWHADWGDAIQNVSSDFGSYSPEAWPGATTMWGASASSLSIAGGVITFRDLESGKIGHALTMSVPEVRAETFLFPAHRTDGESLSSLSLPEGAHLRLKPNLDLATLNLPPLTREMAEAAQKYGIFIRDIAGNVAFNAQDPVTLAENPYLGPGGYFDGSYPRQLLSSFPWSSLELLTPEEPTTAP